MHHTSLLLLLRELQVCRFSSVGCQSVSACRRQAIAVYQPLSAEANLEASMQCMLTSGDLLLLKGAPAGVDRLAFSVMWELDVEGHVLSQWAGRTVIRSCAKLAYHNAQTVIDNDEAGRPQAAEPPVPLQGPHQWSQVMPLPFLVFQFQGYSSSCSQPAFWLSPKACR